jgi:hypothetical protein
MKVKVNFGLMVLTLLLVCMRAVVMSAAATSPGSRTDESQATALVYVEPTAAWASDSNAGTQLSPFRTLARAARAATDYNVRGIGVRVEVGPGTYRESVQIVATANDSVAPMIFEAMTSGTAVIKGSDIWTDWKREGTGGVYSHDWPYAWGLAPYPSGWACCVVLSDLMRRREMIFANDQPLCQVLLRNQLTAGSFFVSEASGTVYVRMPAAMAMATATMEVAVRSNLFFVQDRSNIVLRNLTFRHDNSMLGTTAALTISSSSDVRVDTCIMEWNNYQGLGLSVGNHVTVVRTVANSNGSTGIAGWEMSSTLFADGETSYNNWRGYESGLTDWDSGGMKLSLLRDTTFRRQKANGNLSYGMWLDTDCVDVRFESVSATANLNDGIFLEAVEGPIVIEDSLLADNGRSGVLFGNAAAVSLESNIIGGNGEYQVYVSGNPAGRAVQNYQTGENYVLQSTNCVMHANVIGAATAGELAIATTLPAPQWQEFVDSLSSERNRYQWVDPLAFLWAGGEAIDFATWQSWTHQDSHSCGNCQ